MSKVNVEVVADEVRRLIQPQDQIVFIQSRLATFGHLLAGPVQTLVPRLLSALETAAGPNRTLVFPSFTFKFGRTRVFDPDKTPPETGVLAQEALRSGRYVRTHRPINNYLVRGPRAAEAAARQDQTSWDDASVMAWLVDNHARAITLGITERDHGWIVVHRAEQIAQVPYRYYKRLKGQLERQGEVVGTCEEVLFVRPLNAPSMHDYLPLNTRLAQQNRIAHGQDPRFGIKAVDCADVVETTLDMLNKNPYTLIPERRELLEWVKGGKAAEMAALTPDERWHGD